MRVSGESKIRTSRASVAFVAVVIFIACTTDALADREAALFFASRGDKALKEKDWATAEGHYRKAIQEDETYLPPRLGLAEALLGAQNRAAAVEAFRACIKECEKTAQSKETQGLIEAAQKRLKEIDEAGSALDEMIDSHVTELLTLARKWQAQDPQLFELVLRRVLKLRPDNSAAGSMLEKAGKSATSKTTSIFNGRDLSGWAMGFPTFQVKDGVIVAEIRDGAIIGRSEVFCKGDFDVRAEIQFLEQRPGPSWFGLIGALKGDYNYSCIGFVKGLVNWEDIVNQSAGRRVIFSRQPESFKKPIIQENWNAFELQFRGREIIALINGDEIARDPRQPERGDGFVAIVVQNCKVAFRKIEVTQR